MDAEYPQPWQDVAPIDDAMKRRLGINLPQLLPPLAESPLPGPTPTQPPLSATASTSPLGIGPPPKPPLSAVLPTTAPKPLSQQYGDVESQIQGLKQPQRDDEAYKVPAWKKILGAIAATAGGLKDPSVSGPLYRGVADAPYNKAEQEYERQKGTLEERAKGLQTQSGIANVESEMRARENKPEKPDTMTAQEAQAVEELVTGGMSRVDAIAKVRGSGTKPDTQTQNKERFQDVIAKVDAAKLPTDPKSLPKSLDAALKGGKITQEEHQAASGYLAANPTPSTTIQVQTAGKETAQDIKDANTYYRWTDASGKVRTDKGGKVPKGADAEPIGNDKEYALHLREAGAANIVQQSLNRVAQDVDEHPELFDNASARNIMATTLEQIDRASAGILVAGTGGSIPLPSGMGDMINTALQNKALDSKTAAALKQYIADYKAMKDKGIVQQMEMQGGRIGRGSAQIFQAIIDQIPNGKTADSTTARRQLSNMQATQDNLMKQYRDDGKEQPYKMKSSQAQGGGRQPVIVDGKTVGYATQDEFKAGKMYPGPQ